MLAFSPVTALAQVPSTSTERHDLAEKAFHEGKKALLAREYERAADLFRTSQEAEPAAGTLINLAECYEKLERFASATRTYALGRDAAAKRTPPRNDWVQLASDRIAAIRPFLSYARISGTVPPGGHLELDGEPLDTTALGSPLPMDPGEHRLTMKAGNERVGSQTFAVAPRADVPVTFTWPAPGSKVPQASNEPRNPSNSKSGSVEASEERGPSPLTFVFAGLSVASIGAGTGFLLARNGQIHAILDDERCKAPALGAADATYCNGKVRDVLGYAPQTIFFVAGGALAVASVATYLLTRDSGPKIPSARTVCRPVVGLSYLGCAGTF